MHYFISGRITLYFNPKLKQMKNIFFLVLLIGSLSAFVKDLPNYKATYKINYITNLANNAKRTEIGYLIIKTNQESVYATKNYFKQDSILKLIQAGKINQYDVMNDSYPHTSFKNNIQKKYESQTMVIPTLIMMDYYVYSQKNTIIWQTYPDTLTIKNYKCNKATTTFEGRDYVAWYSTDIPISDGPHKFWGLPGLIIKIADTENHYTFELESFEKFTENFPEFKKPAQVYEVTYENFKQLRKDENENPERILESQGLKRTGGSSNMKLIKRNIIERY